MGSYRGLDVGVCVSLYVFISFFFSFISFF